MKPKFNIDDYDEMTVMNCTTKDEANIFCRYLDSVGLRWRFGGRYTESNEWAIYRDKTCYYPSEGVCHEIDFFVNKGGYTILKFSDFDWGDDVILPLREAIYWKPFLDCWEDKHESTL